MKRRYLALLGCVLLMLGCICFGAAAEEETGSPYVLYFQEKDLREASGGGALRAVSAALTDVSGLSETEIAVRLMEELLAGPTDETLKRSIPVGTNLVSLTVEGTRAYVDLSSAYAVLSGVSLTLADQSIALTLTQLPGIVSVKITVRGRELEYRERQIFTGRNVLLAPEGDVVGTVKTQLYFLNGTGELTPETRTLELYEGDTQAGAVLKALEDGPESKELLPVLPEGFRVAGAWVEEGVCYVSLSSHMLAALPADTALSTALAALDWSFQTLDTVTETRFLVDGEYAEFPRLMELAGGT